MADNDTDEPPQAAMTRRMAIKRIAAAALGLVAGAEFLGCKTAGRRRYSDDYDGYSSSSYSNRYSSYRDYYSSMKMYNSVSFRGGSGYASSNDYFSSDYHH